MSAVPGLSQTPPGLAPGVSSFLQMAVSFTYRHLALFTDTGYIWMGTASLKVCSWDNVGAPCLVQERAVKGRGRAF